MLELLSPAGNMEKLKVAFKFGADACYLAGKKFGLRAFSGNFDEKELNEILNALESGDYNDLYDSVFYEQIIRPFKQKYKKSFSYDYGATKGVIIFEELGFVIKIPFGASLDSEFYGADC